MLLSVVTLEVPEVPEAERMTVRSRGHGLYQVTLHYGFMQTPTVPEVMDRCADRGLETRKTDTSFFLGRETLLITSKGGMARWRKGLFSFLSRNARPANAFFQIPSNRVVELGTQIEL